MDGAAFINLTLGSESLARSSRLAHFSPRLKRHYGMPIPAMSLGGLKTALASRTYWYFLAILGLILDRTAGSVTLKVSLHGIRESLRQTFPRAGEDKMKVAERRQLARLNLRTPLHFRALGVTADKTEHFTEALNVSRGGFFFASSAPLQV